jgi:hypothetical protein
MSEATIRRIAQTRELYVSFDAAILEFIRRQATTWEEPGTEAFDLASKVMSAIDRLPQSLKKRFERRRQAAYDFVTVYGPLKNARPASPEVIQDLHDQVCAVGKYSPI